MASLHQLTFTSDDSEDEDDLDVTSVVLAFADGPLTETDESSAVNKIGGLPSFSPVLDQPPSAECSKCLCCSQEMPLLVQIAAPLVEDQIDPSPNTQTRDLWQRVLYVFGCPRQACHRKSGNVRVYRALRPIKESKVEEAPKLSNPFSMPAPSNKDLDDFDFSTEEEAQPQDESDAVPFDPSQNRWPNPAPLVLPAQYLETSDEPEETADEQVNARAAASSAVDDIQAGVAALGKTSRRGSSNQSNATANNWSGETFEKQQLSGLDDAFVRFQERVFVRAGGDLADQVVRYDRGGQPLPFCAKGDAYDTVFGKKGYSEDQIKRCERCGSRRTFELQVMPQLITILSAQGPLKDKEGELEFGWSTVWCYFCAGDCEGEEGLDRWSEEVALVQYEEA